MSTWSEDFNDALLASPWVPLTASGSMSPVSPDASTSRFILKHARHPARPGYIILLTDLSSVYIEELTAASVPSRSREVARLPPRRGKRAGQSGEAGVEDEDMDDIIKQSEAALKRVQKLCADLGKGDGQGDDLDAEVDLHDYHDGVLTIRTDEASWIFYLTEIKGRQPLEIIASQLIGPLASRSTAEKVTKQKTSKQSPITAVQGLYANATATATTDEADGQATPKPTRAKPGKRAKSPLTSPKQDTASPEPKRAGRAKSIDKHRSAPESPRVRSRNKKEEQAIDADDAPLGKPEDDDMEESAEYASPSPPPARSSARTPRRVVESASPSPPPGPPASKVKAEKVGHTGRPGSRALSASTGRSPSVSRSVDVSATPPSGAAVDEDKEAEEAASQAASQAKSQTKRQREEAEEAELEKRAEEMKRKMAGGGGGGGVLGRRRLRR